MLDKKPKIGVIGLKGLPAFGGAATVGENLIAFMHDKFDFTVYSVTSHTNKQGKQNNYEQIVVKQFFIKRLNIFFYYLKSAIHALLRANYDLIHLHHIDGAFILLLLRLKYKVITTVHARPQIAEKWPWYVKLFFTINERITIVLSNEITCVSKSLYEFYTAKFKTNINFIPNGINLTSESNQPIPPFKNYILFAAGRIIPLKGLHILLKALKTLGFKRKLLVLGDLNQMPTYKKYIHEISKGLDVEYIGLVKEKQLVLGYLKHADLFIFPSYSENMSLMLLEAASMKVAVVASDIPENKAIFNDDEILFFESNNEKDLQNKIKFAFDNPDDIMLRISLAFKKLLSEYTWNKLAPQYTQLYEKILYP